MMPGRLFDIVLTAAIAIACFVVMASTFVHTLTH